MIFYNSARISERMDNGRNVAKRFAKIGMIVAGIASVVASLSWPMSSCGMKVQEFVSGSRAVIPVHTLYLVPIPREG